MENPIGTVIGVLLVSAFPALFIARMVWRNGRVEKAQTWPTTEATVQSGEMEVVASGRGGDVSIPCFAFSYVVNGEYYSGRFGLLPNFGNPDQVLERMKDRKFRVHYDPSKPDTYYVPGEQMEGCDIEQRLSDQLVNIYPKG
jgi:hypothetical protein